MKRMSLSDPAVALDYLNAFVVAEPKVGKTTYHAASALGALPGQKGGLVSGPEYLHIIAVDEAAVEGLAKFLIQLCGISEEVVKRVDVWNMEEDVRNAFKTDEPRSYGWMQVMNRTVESLQNEIAKKPGVHAVLASSFTGMVEAYVRGLAGAPADGERKASGSGMDQDKWQALTGQLTDLRTSLFRDTAHVFWEGHIQKDKPKDGQSAEESIAIPGATGKNWGYNVSQIFRLRREMSKYEGTKIEKVCLDPKHGLAFAAGGRGTAALENKEYDLAEVARKLGKKVGGFDPRAK